ncbi:MAG: hypothetical protein ACOYKE_11225 [Ferruginibacter sp.]
MDNFEKYSRLMMLVVGAILGFLLLIVVLFLLLRLFSSAVFLVPGIDLFLQYVITLFPFLLFYGAFFLIRNSNQTNVSAIAKGISKSLSSIGYIACTIALLLASAVFFKFKWEWLVDYEAYSQYALILLLVLVFFSAISLASGSAKEKDWKERNPE